MTGWAGMRVIHPAITDDTGAQRPVDFGNWARVRASAGPETRFAIDGVARIVRPMGGRPGPITWTLIGIVAIAIVIEVSGAMRTGGPVSASTWVGPVLVVVMCAWCFWYLPRWNLWRYGSSIVPVLAARGICPCCAYSLREVAHVDGFVRCPECGGTWAEARLRPSDAAESVRAGLERIGTGAGVRRAMLDDAGRRTFAILRTPRRAAVDHPDPSMRRRLGEADRAVRRVSASMRFAIVFGAALVLALAAFDSATGAMRTMSWRSALELVQGWGVVIVGCVVVARSYIGLTPAAARAHLLARGLCPTCVSDLSPTPVGGDGNRRCLVCGSAWNRTRGRASEPMDTCAACGYSLVGLDPAGEGRVRCPECGAVGRIDGGPTP